jgi:chemotaxis protein methyltransferase CheR
MFAAYHLAKIDPEMQYEILGTDVDRESVAVATNGVFNVREIKQIPAVYLANHWANGTGDIADFVKAKKSIREKCRFRVANLLDLGELSTYGKFDLIFCRNVFIYFTPEQTKIIAHNLLKTLHESGYLLVGISESLSKMGLPIIPVGPSVYAHKKAVVVTSADKEAYVKKLETSPLVQMPKSAVLIPAKMRVLCVDDSPSVLAVMKQVLRDNHGFEVVGTAINGVEAQRQVKALKPDLVTLDIHMPEMTGLEYLKKHWDKNHPPVVIVSSVAREDASLALECLTAGASDYVEKPSLNNLAERGEEIRIKLACALKRKDQVPIKDELLNHKTLPPLRVQSVRVLIGGMGDQKALTDVMRDLATFKAPIVILTQGVGQAVTAMGQNLEHSSGLKIKPCSQEKLDAHGVFIGELQQHWHLVLENRSAENVSVMVFGSLSSTAQKQLASARGAQILVEDLAGNTPVNMPGWVSDICPTTSFAYRANSFLGIKK